MAILYDSVDIITGNYKLRQALHDQSPDNLINSLKPTRQDGEVVISDNFGMKFITLIGRIDGTSQANLETNIDTFKELVSRKDKNLDITYAGGTRRYVCRPVSCQIERDFYHLTFTPFKVVFLVPAGYGSNTSSTTWYTSAGFTATSATNTATFLGTYQAKPKNSLTLTTRGNADVVRFENTTTGDYMDVDLNGVTGILNVDEETLTVLNGTTNINYRGKFPSVQMGANQQLTCYIYGSGSNLDQSQVDFIDGDALLGDVTTEPWQAQSFVPTQSGRIYKLTMPVWKTDGGTLGGTMQFLIYTDNNNQPGSRVNATGEYEIAEAAVSAAGVTDTDALFTGTDIQRPYLVAGRKYWICLNPGTITGSDANNYFRWGYSDESTSYANGKAMFRKTNISAWQDGYADCTSASGGTTSQKDMGFKEYRGVDGGAASHTLTWVVTYTQKYL